jgi:hypothetical protein
MEIVMLWWDELDDFAALVRHVARAAFAEVVAAGPKRVSRPERMLARVPRW